MIKVAVAGCYGKMGKMLIKAVHEHPELTLTAATVSPKHAALNMDVGSIAGLEPLGFKPVDDLHTVINDFDVLIDFSAVDATLEHVQLCQANNKKIVIGTTGFSPDQMQQIRQASAEIAVLFAPNMSIGVNVCYALLEKVAAVVGNSADIEIIEAHHSQKKDAPSGTALMMAHVVANTLQRDLNKVAVYDRRQAIKTANDIGISSIRAKDIVGEHTVMFALDGERIEITHKASDRSPFAKGAALAANWIAKKKPGFYNMQDALFS